MTEYYAIGPDKLGKDANIPVSHKGSADEMFAWIAEEMAGTIEKNNADGKKTVMIVPVGPVGQYPFLASIINTRRISLKNCWFLNMDEYMSDESEYLDIDDPLSFRGFMERFYRSISADLLMPPEQRTFPDPKDLGKTARLIEELGGVDLCVAGIGINGHIAFNEARADLTAEQYADSHCRVLDIAAETVTTCAISEFGGALDRVPKKAITLGISELMSARRIIIGLFRPWHRSVIRRTIYGEVSAGFPASLLQSHGNTVIACTDEVAQLPFYEQVSADFAKR